MAVSSPRVIEIATGERTDFEELGGVDVHARLTGQLDVIAEDEPNAFAKIRRWLSFMPQHAEAVPARTAWDEKYDVLDEKLPTLVPKRRNRGYDMRSLIPRLTDDGEFFALRPDFGPSLITALARIGGRSVGIVANNPYFFAGSIDAAGCDNVTHFTCLCEAFNIPMIYLQDVPGFFVSKEAERVGIITKILRWFQALALATMPKVTILFRNRSKTSYSVDPIHNDSVKCPLLGICQELLACRPSVEGIGSAHSVVAVDFCKRDAPRFCPFAGNVDLCLDSLVPFLLFGRGTSIEYALIGF